MLGQPLTQCVRVALIFVFALSFSQIAPAGPVRPLYLSTGSQIQVLQGNSVVNSWTTGDQEFSIAVNNTVQTWSQGNPILSPLGREYLPDGTPTGVTYENTLGCCFRDGTTDGQFNYAVRQHPTSGGIYQFDLDWANPQLVPLIPPFASGVTGIAYDWSDDTFWLASGSPTNFLSVIHVTRAGDLISFFGGGEGSNASLAYDGADDTLWIYSARPSLSELIQFAASDDMTNPNFALSRQPGIGFVTGMEFQLQQTPAAVPEPATAGLLAVGIVVLFTLRARKRNHRSQPAKA